MTTLREAATMALELCDRINDERTVWGQHELRAVCEALRAALAEPQSTHSEECWRWHHECAIARIEELKLLCEEMLSELYVYRASKHLKDAAAAIRARGEK